MRQPRRWIGISGAFALFAVVPATAECVANSGPERVALLELYTSEGCSSCPPADRWLAGLGQTGLAPTRVAPLALHVDYWNYIGWTDPFSQTRFTERQQAYSVRGGARSVYTPQFVLNGREYRGWFRGENFTHRIETINAEPATAVISFRLAQTAQETIEVTGKVSVAETTRYERIGVYLALYENNLVNDVRAGENDGKRLRHDYVVRRLEGPLTLPTRGELTLHHLFALAPDWKRPDLGVTVFVQDRVNGQVLQTAMLPPCLK